MTLRRVSGVRVEMPEAVFCTAKIDDSIDETGDLELDLGTIRLDCLQYDDLASSQHTAPVLVGPSQGGQIWWFQDRFYELDASITSPVEAKARLRNAFDTASLRESLWFASHREVTRRPDSTITLSAGLLEAECEFLISEHHAQLLGIRDEMRGADSQYVDMRRGLASIESRRVLIALRVGRDTLHSYMRLLLLKLELLLVVCDAARFDGGTTPDHEGAGSHHYVRESAQQSIEELTYLQVRIQNALTLSGVTDRDLRKVRNTSRTEKEFRGIVAELKTVLQQYPNAACHNFDAPLPGANRTIVSGIQACDRMLSESRPFVLACNSETTAWFVRGDVYTTTERLSSEDVDKALQGSHGPDVTLLDVVAEDTPHISWCTCPHDLEQAGERVERCIHIYAPTPDERFATVHSRTHAVRIALTEYEEYKQRQPEEPVALSPARHGTLWWYRDEYYEDDERMTAEEVRLTIYDRERRRQQKFDRLRKIAARDEDVADARRERIPDDVRAFVWQRDEGRCVRCGADEDLQFDHVIPVAKGGGNSIENVQVLCGDCNRAKGDAIV